MGNVMQIVIEALAVFYFDFIFAFLSLPVLSKVTAGDTLFIQKSPFIYGIDTVHSRRTGVAAKESSEEPSHPHTLWLFLRNPDLTCPMSASSFTLWVVPGHAQFSLGIGSQF